MNLQGRHFRRRALAWYSMLFGVFLLLANAAVYHFQNDLLVEQAEQRGKTVMDVLVLLTRETLLREDYALTRWMLTSWGRNHPDVALVRARNENGVEIVRLVNTAAGDAHLVLEQVIDLTHRRTVWLEVGFGDQSLRDQLGRLLVQMALVSVAAVLILGLSAWWLLRGLAIVPLEREVMRSAEAERLVGEQRRYLQSVIDNINDGILAIGRDYEVTLMNKTAREGWDDDIIADPEHPRCYEILHHRSSPCTGSDHPCPLREVAESLQPKSVVHNVPDGNGNPRYLELAASPMLDQQGQFVGIIESSRDLTAHLRMRDELEQKKVSLEYQAQHDALTGLPNRLLLIDRLSQGIYHARRQRRSLALLFVDLDEFKQINDSFGHEVGDEVLKQVAVRLQSALRSSDTVARLGGDEFNVVLTNLDDGDQAASAAEKLIREIRQPCTIGEEQFVLTCSVGISVYPKDAQVPSDLMRYADTAMFKAKAAGRNSFRFYTESMTAEAYDRVTLEKQLRDAVAERQFELHYQPQFDVTSDKIIGVEALVRWRHPAQGLVAPGRFIGLAESTGLIVSIGQFVMQTAFAQVAAWHAAGLTAIRVSVNLSVRELQQPELPEKISGLLEQANCRPEWVELEVTESLFMDHPDLAVKVLNRLRDIGMVITIDDFGTGYSSLSYLKQLPIDRLKIDRSFVDGLPEDGNDSAIASAIIAMGRNLGLRLVAEGVETEDQLDYLRSQGCHEVQGFLFSRPLSAESMTVRLRQPIQSLRAVAPH